MTQVPNHQLPARNLDAQRKHRRQMFWQILLPVILGAAGLIALGVLSSLAGDAKVSQGASAALIWLIVPNLLLCLVGLGIVVLMTVGVWKLNQVLPTYTYRLQQGIIRLGKNIDKVGDALVEPVLRTRGGAASFRALWNELRRLMGL